MTLFRWWSPRRHARFRKVSGPPIPGYGKTRVPSARLVLAAAGAGSAVVGSRVAEAATILYSDGFRRTKTTKGWGKNWYSLVTRCRGVSPPTRGYFVLDPEGNADPLNPSPVLVLNRDVRDVDIIAKIYSRN